MRLSIDDLEAVPAALGAPSGPSGSGVVDVEGSATGLAPQADSARSVADELEGCLRRLSVGAGSLTQGGGAASSAADDAAACCEEAGEALEAYAQAARSLCDLASEEEGSAPALFGAGVLADAPRDPGAFQAWYEGLSDGQKALVDMAVDLVKDGAPAVEDAMRMSAMASVASVFAANPGLSSSESLSRLGLPQHSADMLKAYSEGTKALGEAAFDYEHPIVGKFEEVGEGAKWVGRAFFGLDLLSTYQKRRAQIGEWMPGDEASVKAGAETAFEVGIPLGMSHFGESVGEAAGTAIGSTICPGAGTVIGGVVGGVVGAAGFACASSLLIDSTTGQKYETYAVDRIVDAYRGIRKYALASNEVCIGAASGQIVIENGA